MKSTHRTQVFLIFQFENFVAKNSNNTSEKEPIAVNPVDIFILTKFNESRTQLSEFNI